jgi:hypothetical protein
MLPRPTRSQNQLHFSSRRRFERVQTRIESAVASLHFCIRSISASTSCHSSRPSASYFDFTLPFSMFLDVHRASNSSDFRDSFFAIPRAPANFSDLFLPPPTFSDFRIHWIRLSSSLAFFKLPRTSPTLPERIPTDYTFLKLSRLSNSLDSGDPRTSGGGAFSTK